MIPFEQARGKVIAVTAAMGREMAREIVELRRAHGRVLAESIRADRDYPPFDRSTRDGFAVRAADAGETGATLKCIGEVKAGSAFEGAVGAGECVQIMTGAALPAGADAVVMIEHVRIEGQQTPEATFSTPKLVLPGSFAQNEVSGAAIKIERAVLPGQSIVQRGSEARAGQELLHAGARLGYAEMALAAQVGHPRVRVNARPRVAILSTGDEVVDFTATPGPWQVRDGNGLALETMVTLAGGEPAPLGIAPDEKAELGRRIERGLEADALVLSGGVSMGKYDLVEVVLAELGAEIHFDAVAIRPGRPAVFGSCRGKPVFGLPGNPVSTMVTFELFVAPAIDVLGGAPPRPLAVRGARLTHALREKGALTHFLPARVELDGRGEPRATALRWQGSGDIVALAQASAFLIVPAEKLDWEAGEWAEVLEIRR